MATQRKTTRKTSTRNRTDDADYRDDIDDTDSPSESAAPRRRRRRATADEDTPTTRSRTRRTPTDADDEDARPTRRRPPRARATADVESDRDDRARRTRPDADDEGARPTRRRRPRSRAAVDAEPDADDTSRRTQPSRSAKAVEEDENPPPARRAHSTRRSARDDESEAERRPRRRSRTRAAAKDDADDVPRARTPRRADDDWEREDARDRDEDRPGHRVVARSAAAERGRPSDAEKPARKRGGRRKAAAQTDTRKTATPQTAGRKQPSRRRDSERDSDRNRTKAPVIQRRRLPVAVTQELVASVNPRESRIALLEDGKPAELMIDRPDSPNLVGSIILGRVDSVVPGIEAAFIDVGLEKNGFLYVQDVIGTPGDYDVLESLEQDARPRRYQRHHINKLLQRDQTVVVQVKKEPMGGKGVRLTSYLTIPGRYCVMMPNVAQLGVSRKIEGDKERDRLRKIVRRVRPKGMGLILRTAAEGAHEDDIEADVDHLLHVWERIQDKQKGAQPPKVLHQDMRGVLQATREVFTSDVKRFVIDNRSAYEAVCGYLEHMAPHLVNRVEFYDADMPLFEKFGLNAEIDRALDTRVPLPSGGYLLIDQTEAVVTIDVNTGSYTGSRRLEETVYHTNLEAVDVVVRQLRLRDLGGIVLIDFIDMESMAYRKNVYNKLLEALERDRSKTRVQDMSELCIVQLTRKRTKYSLQKTLCSTCPTCHGRGMLASAVTLALHILREIEMKTRQLQVEHVLVEAHPSITEYLSHTFAYELQDLENYIETLILLHPVEDKGPEYTNVIVEGVPLDAEGTARRRRRRGSRGGRGRRPETASA